MAETKTPQPKKMTAAQIKKENDDLKKELQKLQKKTEVMEDMGFCYLCGKHKNKRDFHKSSDPSAISGIVPVCKDCVEQIACPDGKTPTKESCILALSYINKPFVMSIWESSISEVNTIESSGFRNNKGKNVWHTYIKNVSMPHMYGLTFRDSDIFKDYDIGARAIPTMDEQEIIDSHSGVDVYDSFLKNKADVIRLLSYDPFEGEPVANQPLLYSHLLGLLDSEESSNSNMVKTASAISIARCFTQLTRTDDTLANLMTDTTEIEKNAETIRKLQDNKSKLTTMITNLAEESCLSLKHNKSARKGEDSWTGKIKKIKDLNLRDGRTNGFDIATCRAMQQIQEISDASIMKQIKLDESDWSDMVATMREDNQKLRKEVQIYEEINRYLLQENLDLKDFLEEQGIDIFPNIRDLKELYSPLSELEEEVEDYETFDSSDEDDDIDMGQFFKDAEGNPEEEGLS